MPTSPIQRARESGHTGHFGRALKQLAALTSSEHFLERSLLRLELLERIGDNDAAERLALVLLSDQKASLATQALCQFVLGRTFYASGDIDQAIGRLQHSANLAKSCGDLERQCWSELHLMLFVADRSGPAAASPLLANARANAGRLADPIFSAALHVFVAQIAAKRGEVSSAKRHLATATSIAQGLRNVWLATITECTRFATSLISSELNDACNQGELALELAQETGSLSLRRVCLVNLSNLYFRLGEFDRAIEFSEVALPLLTPASDPYYAELDNLARIRLAQGNLEAAQSLLARLPPEHPARRLRYVYRHSLETRLKLLLSLENWDEASYLAEDLTASSEQSGDVILLRASRLGWIESRVRSGRLQDAAAELLRTIPLFLDAPLHSVAERERLLALWLKASGNCKDGIVHLRRAEAMFSELRSAPAITELGRGWGSLTEECEDGDLGETTIENGREREVQAIRNTLQVVAALIRCSGYSGLVAKQVGELLAAAGCTQIESRPFGRGDDAQGAISNLAAIGLRMDRSDATVHLSVADPQVVACVESLEVICDYLRRLEKARLSEEAEATLWPLGDDAAELQSDPPPGSMAELMNLAQRVATANLPVLLTGESGAGKEVIARYLHKHSPRASHLFLPFNCSATPRDTIESQLFGHRRGAFTGADRDAPGVIRTAEHGTLFLDEIADLGLDLQPKLLRFLESGEIFPLGDTRPSTVDVRIVAATNADLERAVAEGRFREDLFYRLNVIRLRVPPLRARRDEIPTLARQFAARAAAEAGKTNIRLADETVEQLTLYRWPGNVRQLQNEIRRMVAMTDSDTTLRPQHLAAEIRRELPAPPVNTPAAAAPPPPRPAPGKLRPALEKVEREMIQAALDAHLGDLTAAARTLGLSRKGLYLKRQRLGL